MSSLGAHAILLVLSGGGSFDDLPEHKNSNDHHIAVFVLFL